MHALLLTLCLTGAPDAGVASAPIQFPAEKIVWNDAPRSMPKGAKIAVLEGDPRADGMFTIRVLLPKGFQLPPHTHPRDERVTILSGSVYVGFGESLVPLSGKKFGPGSFYLNPPGLPHYLSSDEEVVMQLTGMGPWVVDFVEERPRRDKKTKE